MRSPFDIHTELHGPMRRSDKVVFILTASLGIWLVLFLFLAAAVVLP